MAKRNLPLGGAIPMESGERDRLVTVQQMTETLGPTRAVIETWSTLTNVWMRKLELSGRERFASAQLSASGDTQWEAPYRSDLDPELVDVPKYRRLLYQGRVYDITSASQIGRREGIELLTIANTKA